MAIIEDFIIEQGSTFSKTFVVTDANDAVVDISSGYTAMAQFRKNYTTNTAVTFTIGTLNANGEITVTLTANQTANTSAARYVYDVELTDSGGNVARVTEGRLTVSTEVTKI